MDLRSRKPVDPPSGVGTRPLTVLVNGLAPRLGGGLTYLTEQLSALERVRPDVKIRLLASDATCDAFRRRLNCEITVVKVRGVLWRLAYENLVLPFIGKEVVLYCPSNFRPLLRAKRPVVVTLQNALYFGSGRRARSGPKFRRGIETLLAHFSAIRSDRTIVISQSLLQMLRSDGIAHDRLRYLPTGTPVWPNEAEIPPGFAPDLDFFLAIANDFPYKHLDFLVDVWSAAFSEHHSPTELVIVGTISETRKARFTERVDPALRGRLRMCGPISSRGQMKWLIENARSLVNPSSLESLGLPSIEARSLSCPTILSSIPPHLETGGPLARFFAVGDAEALTALLLSARLRNELAVPDGGWPHSWDDNAKNLACIFAELI